MVYGVLFTWYLLAFKAYFPEEEKDMYNCKYGISYISYLVDDHLNSAAWVSIKMIHILTALIPENLQRLHASKTFIWAISLLTFQIWNLHSRITFCPLLFKMYRSDRILEFTKLWSFEIKSSSPNCLVHHKHNLILRKEEYVRHLYIKEGFI